MPSLVPEYPFTAEKICLTPPDGLRLGHSQSGCCAATGASKRHPDEKIIDTGMSVFDDTPNGDIFLSEAYVKELGHLIGMVEADKIAEANVAVQNAERRAEAADKRWVESSEAFRSLVTMIANDPAQATMLAKQMLPELDEHDGTLLAEAPAIDAFATGPKYRKPRAVKK